MKFEEENIYKSDRIRYRVGIRRNLVEFPFLNALRNCEKQILFERILLVISCKFKGHFTPNDSTGISQDPTFEGKDLCIDECRGLYKCSGKYKGLVIYLNFEDHLRLYSNGETIEQCINQLVDASELIEQECPFAINPDFG